MHAFLKMMRMERRIRGNSSSSSNSRIWTILVHTIITFIALHSTNNNVWLQRDMTTKCNTICEHKEICNNKMQPNMWAQIDLTSTKCNTICEHKEIWHQQNATQSVNTKGRSFRSKINSSNFCPRVQNSFRGHSAFTKTRRTSQICKELKFQTHQYHPRLKRGLTKWEEPLPLSPVNLCAKPQEWEYQARCQCFFPFCLRESKRMLHYAFIWLHREKPKYSSQCQQSSLGQLWETISAGNQQAPWEWGLQSDFLVFDFMFTSVPSEELWAASSPPVATDSSNSSSCRNTQHVKLK